MYAIATIFLVSHRDMHISVFSISVYCDNYDNYYLRISRKIMINLLITGNGGSPSASPTTPSAPSVPAGTMILVNSLILRQRCKFQIQDANFRMLHLFYSSEICPKTIFYADGGSKTIPTGGQGSSDGSLVHVPFSVLFSTLFIVAYLSAPSCSF